MTDLTIEIAAMHEVVIQETRSLIVTETGENSIVIELSGAQGIPGPAGAGGGVVDDGDYGDVIVSASGLTWTIDPNLLTAFMRTVTASANEAAFKAAVNLEIGVDVQAYSANLDEFAAVNPSAAGLALLDDADAAAQLVTLGFTASLAELNYMDGVTSLVQDQLDAKQPLDADLTALADNTTDGLWAHTGAGTGAARTLAAPATGLTITNPAGIAGNPTFAFANDLGALEALASTGFAVRTALDTWAQRTITGTANEIAVADGNGIGGNPTLSLPSALTFTGKTVTGGTFASPTAITGLPDPTNAQDAATKAYVDSLAAGLDVKPSVRAATTANITLSGAQTIDGVSVVATDRVLVKNQTAPAENGIYVAAAGAWARATDMDAWAEVPGAFVFVEQGTLYADTAFVSTANAGGTLNTTAITWSQFAGAGTYTAGTGLSLTGTQFAISDAELLAIAGLTSAADKGIYFTGAGTAATFDFTAYGRTLAALADETALEALLDTLPNLTSIQGLAITLADAGADALWGWDDSASAYVNLSAADARTALGMSANGQSLVTAADYAAMRTLLTLVIGTNVQAFDATLTALAAYNTNGFLVQTAADTFAGRTIAVTASTGLAVSNGNGVAGNPTLSGVDADTTTKGVSEISTTTEVLTGTDATRTVSPDGLAALWEKGSNTASAATVAIGEGGFLHITGTTGISDIDFSTAKDGRTVDVIFDGILTLTNGANLALPGAANITTQAGDRARFVQDNGDAIVCLYYQRADGTSLVGGGGGFTAASQAQMEAASDTSVGVTPGRQHFHPSAAKFWAFVTVSGGVPTLSTSYNVTSITDSGVGTLTITIATDFSSANWSGHVSVYASANGNVSGSNGGTTAGTFIAYSWQGTAVIDPLAYSAVGYGDQ